MFKNMLEKNKKRLTMVYARLKKFDNTMPDIVSDIDLIIYAPQKILIMEQEISFLNY